MMTERELTDTTVIPISRDYLKEIFINIKGNLHEYFERDSLPYQQIMAGEITGVDWYAKLALVENADGEHYLLDDEGVLHGVAPLEYESVTVGLFPKYKASEFSTIPFLMSIIDEVVVEHILNDGLTEERVNLADFVRKFGARLERNYDSLRVFFDGEDEA